MDKDPFFTVDPDLQHCMEVVVTTALGIQLGEDDHGMRIVKVTGTNHSPSGIRLFRLK